MSDHRSELAAKRFPKEWAVWSTRTGPGASKRRQQLRKAAEDAIVMDGLRSKNASCATCSSFEPRGPGGPHCAKDSDFHGYTLVLPTDLCARWMGKDVG